LDNLPDPNVLALDIEGNLEAGLESYRAVIVSLNDKEIENIFVKEKEKTSSTKLEILFSLFLYIDKELKHKGVTRTLLLEDYK